MQIPNHDAQSPDDQASRDNIHETHLDFDNLQIFLGNPKIPSSVPSMETLKYATDNKIPHIGTAWVNEGALDKNGQLTSLLNTAENNVCYNYYSAHKDDGTDNRHISSIQKGDAMYHAGGLRLLESVIKNIIYWVVQAELESVSVDREVWGPVPTAHPTGARFWEYLACRALSEKCGGGVGGPMLNSYGLSEAGDRQRAKYTGIVGRPSSLLSMRMACRFFNTEVAKYCFTRFAFTFQQPAELAKFLITAEQQFGKIQEPAMTFSAIVLYVRHLNLSLSSQFLAVQDDFKEMPSSCDEKEWRTFLGPVEAFNKVLSMELGCSVTDWLARLQMLLENYKVNKLVLVCRPGVYIFYDDDGRYDKIQVMLGSRLTKELYIFEDVGGWGHE
jgi:hypothetical protein